MTMLDWIRLHSAIHCPVTSSPFGTGYQMEVHERGLEKDAPQRCLYIASGMCMRADLSSSGGGVTKGSKDAALVYKDRKFCLWQIFRSGLSTRWSVTSWKIGLLEVSGTLSSGCTLSPVCRMVGSSPTVQAGFIILPGRARSIIPFPPVGICGRCRESDAGIVIHFFECLRMGLGPSAYLFSFPVGMSSFILRMH